MTPSFREAFFFWLKLGFISFGGPAGQIAIMHRELVDRRKWISEGEFMHALNYCMLLPGPEAQQLATYLGWRLHGNRGGVVAGSLFVLPSVFLLLALSYVYAAYGHVPGLAAVFYGLKCVVLALVLEAVFRLGKKSLKTPLLAGVAVLAYVALTYLHIAFPWVLLGAALVGFGSSFFHKSQPLVLRPENEPAPGPGAWPARGTTLKTALVCAGCWLLPLAVAWAVLGSGSILVQQGFFFSKAALMTFGGAYAVLPYVADHAVSMAWLNPSQMMAGLALAESTPGPLIMVLQFVGFLGGWQSPDPGWSPLFSAVLCAGLTTWCTFLPSFLFILVGAPYVERLRGLVRFDAALSAVTSAVVGVVFGLAVWFGSHLLVPLGERFDLTAAVLALLAFVLLKFRRVEVLWVVLAGGAAGWCVTALGWVS